MPFLHSLLKILSREIDFKNFDKFTGLSLTKERGWFKFCRGSGDFIRQEVYFLRLINAILRWLNNVSCLFLSFLLIASGVPIVVH